MSGFDEKPLLFLLKASDKNFVKDLFDACFRFRHEGLSQQVSVAFPAFCPLLSLRVPQIAFFTIPPRTQRTQDIAKSLEIKVCHPNHVP